MSQNVVIVIRSNVNNMVANGMTDWSMRNPTDTATITVANSGGRKHFQMDKPDVERFTSVFIII